MSITENAGSGLHGRFRDVMRDGADEVRWDHGWQENVIVTDFRRVLAGFIRGSPPVVTGLVGLRVGAGLAAWDSPPGPPPATPDTTALVDPAPFTVARARPADRLRRPGHRHHQRSAHPLAPDPRLARAERAAVAGRPAHPTSTLREFGLVATLGGADVLLNYRTHPAIAKDPASTLERTIWLVF